MRSWVYSRWDGSQGEFALDGRRALEAMSDLLMEGLSAEEALEWMRRHGFEMAGMDFRVMGIDELVSELRDQIRSLERQYNMDQAMDDVRRRLDEILARERDALEERQGYESSRMNDFQERRHAEGSRISEAVERFRDYEFEDADAGDDFRDLLDELDRMSGLEDFIDERGQRFQGPESADYETAQDIRRQIQALEQMARDLASGDFETISPEELQELLGGDAARSLVMIRDLESTMRDAGFLRGTDPELTPRAIRQLGAHALAEVYGALQKDRSGGHETDARGAAIPRPDETRPYEFGDPLEIDTVRTVLGAVKRRALRDEGSPLELPVRLTVDDFEIRELEFSTQTTSVLLLDLSWSMSFAGRFPAAKRVALAMDHLVRTKFPRDHFFVVGFSTRAHLLGPEELPEVSWDMGDPFTNLQEGLMIAEQLISKHPCNSPQVLVVTDGQPTAYFQGTELHVEWPMGFGGVSPNAVIQTMNQVRRITRRGATINTFMLDDAPELVGFVEHMTQINKGRAFFTRPSQLGSFLMVDYLKGHRKRSG